MQLETAFDAQVPAQHHSISNGHVIRSPNPIRIFKAGVIYSHIRCMAIEGFIPDLHMEGNVSSRPNHERVVGCFVRIAVECREIIPGPKSLQHHERVGGMLIRLPQYVLCQHGVISTGSVREEDQVSLKGNGEGCINGRGGCIGLPHNTIRDVPIVVHKLEIGVARIELQACALADRVVHIGRPHDLPLVRVLRLSIAFICQERQVVRWGTGITSCAELGRGDDKEELKGESVRVFITVGRVDVSGASVQPLLVIQSLQKRLVVAELEIAVSEAIVLRVFVVREETAIGVRGGEVIILDCAVGCNMNGCD